MTTRSYPEGSAVTENCSNGNGYWMYVPQTALTPQEGFEVALQQTVPRFSEVPTIMQHALEYRSLLLEGKPGAGKSNVFRDLEDICVLGSVKALRVALHINAGHNRNNAGHVDLIRSFVDTAAEENGGVMLLDNADYPGYRGKSRSRRSATQYAEEVVPAFQEAVAEGLVTVLGTAHTDAWRANRWQWDDPAIDVPSQQLLDSFAARTEFQGFLTGPGLVQTLYDRLLDEEAAHSFAEVLAARGLTSFFYAHHMDLHSLLEDPEKAIYDIEAGRRLRNGDEV